MQQKYKPEVVQRIELVLARYGSGANLGSSSARETIAKEIWSSVLQIINRPNAEDMIPDDMNNEFDEAKERQIRKLKEIDRLPYKVDVVHGPNDPGDENVPLVSHHEQYKPVTDEEE
mgnify:FL=1